MRRLVIIASALALACSVPLPSTTARPASPAAASSAASPTAATTPGPAAPAGINFPSVSALSAPSPSVVWAVTDEKRLFRSSDQGETWVERPVPAPAPVSSIAFVTADEGWLLRRGSPATQCMAQGFELWHTRDGATSWSLIARADSSSTLNDISFRQCKGAPTFADGQIGILTADDPNGQATIYRTADGGSTWQSTRLSDPPGLAPGTAGSALHTASAKWFGATLLLATYAWRDGKLIQFVLRSEDHGETWIPGSAIEGGNFIVLLGRSRWLRFIDGFEETMDAGRTWHKLSTDYVRQAPVSPSLVFADEAVGYAFARFGLARTRDGGRHWESLGMPGL